MQTSSEFFQRYRAFVLPAVTAACLALLISAGSASPFSTYLSLRSADAAAGVSVDCSPIAMAPGNASGLDAYGKPTYDVFLPCELTAPEGRHVVIAYPQEYEGRDWQHGDTPPYSWGYLTHTSPSWRCDELPYRGINCVPTALRPSNNGQANNNIAFSFRAIGQCGTAANVAAKHFAPGQEAANGANAGWAPSWTTFTVQFPACPTVASSASSTVPSSMPSQPQCSDGRDNDGDGAMDYQDAGCYANGFYNPNDNDESNPAQSSSSVSSVSSSGPACSDGRDNDGDGKTDTQDPGCYTNGFYNPGDTDEFDAAVSSSSSSSAYPCSWLGNCPQSSISSSVSSQNPCGWYCTPSSSSQSSVMSSQQSSYAPCGWSGCQPQSSSSSSAHCGGWCGWGFGNWFNTNANAATTVNNQVNAGAWNNTAVTQQGGFWQNAAVTPTANTTVNNQINAGSRNNVGGWVW